MARRLGVGVVWLTTTHRRSVRGRSMLAGALWAGRVVPAVMVWCGTRGVVPVLVMMTVWAGHTITARQR